jgi:hypothetical protein
MDQPSVIDTAPAWAREDLARIQPDAIRVHDYDQQVWALKGGHTFVLRSPIWHAHRDAAENH